MSVYQEKHVDKATKKVTKSNVWTMDFQFNGMRIRESTHQTSITRAKEVEAKRKQDLREGTSGIRKKRQPKLFSFSASDWLEAKKASLAPRSIVIEGFNLAHRPLGRSCLSTLKRRTSPSINGSGLLKALRREPSTSKLER
jgi:hypothetical protein